MGNNQSQGQSPNPIHNIPRRIANKITPAALRDRQKDSGYGSGSASSSGTVTKGVRTSEQASATAVSAGSEHGTAPRTESAPDTTERARDAPAPPTRSAETVGPQ